MLQSIGPLVERGAVAAVGEGAEIRTFGAGAGIVEVGVAGRVGNDVGHRDAEIVMYGVGHGVAVHVLAAGGMAGNDDGLEVGEDVFLCQLAQDLVGEIERRQLFIIGGRAAGAPTVSGATPAHLVGRQLVAATSGAGGEVRCDDDGVVERAAQERGGEGGAEVVIGVAGGAVDDDECARDLGIRAVERVGAVDEGAGGSAGESHPFGTVGHDGAWRRPSGGGQETKGKQLHWRLGYNVSHGGSPLAAFLLLSPLLGTKSATGGRARTDPRAPHWAGSLRAGGFIGATVALARPPHLPHEPAPHCVFPIWLSARVTWPEP